jgi:hypothetical protein
MKRNRLAQPGGFRGVFEGLAERQSPLFYLRRNIITFGHLT